jgi:hypothetical protein
MREREIFPDEFTTEELLEIDEILTLLRIQILLAVNEGTKAIDSWIQKGEPTHRVIYGKESNM